MKTICKTVYYIVLVILLVFCGTISYLADTWKELTYQEIVFHLKTSIAGTSPEMVMDGLLRYGLPVLIIMIACVVILAVLQKKTEKIKRIVAIILLIILVLANILNLIRFNKSTGVITDFINSVRGNNGPDFVGDNYVSPNSVTMTFPEQKRNLIYIYLESMETTYSDTKNGGGFDFNCIPNLTKLSQDNDDFSGDESTLNGGIILPGTQWTTAALFAQSSGLPLQLPVEEGSTKDAPFFPELVAVGDILEAQGYKSMVQLGSPADFGAQEAYYTQHGDYEIHDYDYAVAHKLIPADYYVNWGYEDEKLFDFAKDDILELAANDQPFNYTMFTIDTHFEDGYVCRLCGNEFGDNQYANVMACSDRQVTDFVNWIQAQDFYDNTTIVITGDHTTMDSDFCNDVSEDYQRKTYTCIINSAVEPQREDYRSFSTIDLFPTTLAALGVELSSDRVACGTNLYGTQDTLLEEYGKEKCAEAFGKDSELVLSLANVHVSEEDVKIAQEGSYLESADENGHVRFRLYGADSISHSKIEELKIVITDMNTGETQDQEMEIVQARTGWHSVAHTDIPMENLPYLQCKIYVTAEDYKDYLLKEFTPDQFEMWDIRWDVD